MKKRILVILGSTATGKTDLALYLAKKFNGELISCDSRQVYQGLDIGTGKLPNQSSTFSSQQSEIVKKNNYWIMDGIKIWLYDLVSLKTQYTVFDYVQDATRVIEEISSRGKLPIIVGGTGLYLKALLEGFSHLSIPADPALRNQLELLSLEDLQKRLQERSKEKWDSLNNSDQKNKRRLVRQIELLEMNPYGREFQISLRQPADQISNEYKVLKIGLSAPREFLYEKINKRVYKWMEEGIVEEVEKLHSEGVSWERFDSLGLEYRLIAEYIKNSDNDKDRLIKTIQTKVRQYAKRQITWYKIQPNIDWFDVTDKKYLISIEKQVEDWYNKDSSKCKIQS